MDQDTSKVCPRCAQRKSATEFYRLGSGKLSSYCKPCKAAYRLERYVPRTPQHATACEQCGGPIPEGRSNRPKRFCGRRCSWTWHNANTGADYRRDSWLRNHYGISLAEYQTRLASQHGVCALCATPEAEARNGVLDVDHDHESGSVRGLLCHRCNWALGILGDDLALLRRAAAYLEANASR